MSHPRGRAGLGEEFLRFFFFFLGGGKDTFYENVGEISPV